jgi:hypothetical protein
MYTRMCALVTLLGSIGAPFPWRGTPGTKDRESWCKPGRTGASLPPFLLRSLLVFFSQALRLHHPTLTLELVLAPYLGSAETHASLPLLPPFLRSSLSFPFRNWPDDSFFLLRPGESWGVGEGRDGFLEHFKEEKRLPLSP